MEDRDLILILSNQRLILAALHIVISALVPPGFDNKSIASFQERLEENMNFTGNRMMKIFGEKIEKR
jgi:hypothetical protein